MKPTPRPTVKPTAFPTAAPTDICHKTACGKKDRCSEQASCARHEDLHELRCCSDSTKPGWTKRGDSCPWTESNNFATGETDCLHAQTYNQANDFCASIDARLCIADAPADAGSCFNQFTCPPRFICPELGAICTSPPFDSVVPGNYECLPLPESRRRSLRFYYTGGCCCDPDAGCSGTEFPN